MKEMTYSQLNVSLRGREQKISVPVIYQGPLQATTMIMGTSAVIGPFRF